MSEKRCLAKDLSVEDEIGYQKLSPFELKNHLIERAMHAAKPPGRPYLNAGRGNPNFFNTLARKALCKLTYFALDVARPKREKVPHLGFMPDPAEVTEERFLDYFSDDRSAEAVFLKDAVETAITVFDLDPDELIRELTDAVRGDFYPDPPRIFHNIERIVKRYLEQILISDPKIKGRPFKVFATEGATAGMLYVFNSLKENFMLEAGDRVAVVTPVFSPYLEIPKLNDYQLELVPLDASKDDGWQLPEEQLDKLRQDRSIKALYLINPTNPGAVALRSETIEALADVVSHHNPGLIIIVDAVYSTFVKSYQSIINRMPANCITVYSFSKYFGVTGWRLGVVMLYRDNVIDRELLPALHSQEMDVLRRRYGIVSEHPDALTFMERMVLDSREVALAHTGGLSCPQQVQMALFALFNLLHQDTYKPAVRRILRRRTRLLNEELMGLEVPAGPLNTHYYTLIDVLQLAEDYANKRRKRQGKKFARFLLRHFYPVDFVFCLAIDKASVVLPGRGFFESEPVDPKKVTPEDRNNWSIRVSLANLNDRDYTQLGKNLMATLKKYYKDYRRHR